MSIEDIVSEELLNKCLKNHIQKLQKYIEVMFPNCTVKPVVMKITGKRFHRIIRLMSSHVSVTMEFIDIKTGDIYKARDCHRPGKKIGHLIDDLNWKTDEETCQSV